MEEIMENELKPIIGNLLKLNVLDYIRTDDFRYNLIEHNMDELWNRLLNDFKVKHEINVIERKTVERTNLLEDTLEFMVQILWCFEDKGFFLVFLSILLKGLKNNLKKDIEDIEEVIEKIHNLEIFKNSSINDLEDALLNKKEDKKETIIFNNEALMQLAELICGDEIKTELEEEGIKSADKAYRKGNILDEFFRSAGLTCPDFDGSTRKYWVNDRLKEYNSSNLMDKVLLHLCNPNTYMDLQVSEKILEKVNNLLYFNNLKIELAGLEPLIIHLGKKESERLVKEYKLYESKFTEDLKQNKHLLGDIIKDEDLCFVLENRWEELDVCFNSGSYLSCVILLGSVMEGALYDFIENHPEKARANDNAPKYKKSVKPFDKWGLYNFIDVAHSEGWIKKDRKDLSQKLRDYRNFVHPKLQEKEKFRPDEGTCRITLSITIEVLNDLDSCYQKENK